ncbi:RDD family protein [Nocardia sp. NBC_01377]|uniref:RDD family protein n=1 Tax=Nocardia sp. NBC_01377 TaxID=2903595 RepID=UPI00324E85DA
MNHTTSEVWFAGDPKKYGVVSRPGGADLRYAYFSKNRQPPRFVIVGRDSDGRKDEGASVEVSHTLTRERGHIFMKPVGGQADALVPHGARGDVRYPSPRMFRRFLAFAVDWVVHVGLGLGTAIALSPAFSVEAVTRFDWRHLGVHPALVLGCWMSASALDRIGAQAVFRTTVGKALFGLRVIRPDDGTHPSSARLLVVWLVDLYLLVAAPIALVALSDLPGPDNVDDYLLPAVRRTDLKQTSPVGRALARPPLSGCLGRLRRRSHRAVGLFRDDPAHGSALPLNGRSSADRLDPDRWPF